MNFPFDSEHFESESKIDFLFANKMSQLHNEFISLQERIESESKVPKRWVNIQCNLIDEQIASNLDILDPPFTTPINFTPSTPLQQYIIKKREKIISYFEGITPVQAEMYITQKEPQQEKVLQSQPSLGQKCSSKLFERVKKIQLSSRNLESNTQSIIDDLNTVKSLVKKETQHVERTVLLEPVQKYDIDYQKKLPRIDDRQSIIIGDSVTLEQIKQLEQNILANS